MFVFEGKKYNCSFELALAMIGRKWNSMLIYHLSSGTKRYGELKKLMPDVTQKMLTQSLRELEKFQLIHRKVYAVVPPKVEYSLTDYGKELIPILQKIQKFGEVMYERYESEGIVRNE